MATTYRGKLLIVDDDEDLQRSHRRVAEAQGYEVVQAFDGLGVVTLALAEQPDLILLDINMPDSDGRDVLATLKTVAGTVDIPVILCSAKTDQFDRHLGLELGAEDYVDKPCNVELLMRKIGYLIERARRPSSDGV